jgi:hypothetical protein
MRVVRSLLIGSLIVAMSAHWAHAQSGAFKGIDEVVELAIRTFHLESKIQTPAQKADFAKKINAENLTKLTNTEIAKKLMTDASYKSVRETYNVSAQNKAVATTQANTQTFFASLEAKGTQPGYNPSVETTTKIWSEVLGMDASKGKLVHSALMATPEGRASLEKIATWQMAFTRNLSSDLDKQALLKLIDAETMAAAKHIQVTGNRVCDNLSGEGLNGFADYVTSVVKNAKVNMSDADLKALKEEIYTKTFGRDGEQALKEVCAACPGTLKC